MNFRKCLLAVELAVLITAVGCSHHAHKKVAQENKKEAEESYVSNVAAEETKAQSFVSIKFRPGSATLTDTAKTSLSSIVKNEKRDGKIDKVIVLSWSDQEYPSQDLKKLPKAQRELAERRNKAVENYIKQLRDVRVSKYNMAERPTAFSKLFNTADNKLKGSLLSAGLSTTADSADYSDKASQSVILIKTK